MYRKDTQVRQHNQMYLNKSVNEYVLVDKYQNDIYHSLYSKVLIEDCLNMVNKVVNIVYIFD
jgi:hypothetical protein